MRWAELLTRKGDIDEAEAWLKRAERAFARAGDVHSVAVAQGYIADILFRRGELDEALRIQLEERLPASFPVDRRPFGEHRRGEWRGNSDSGQT